MFSMQTVNIFYSKSTVPIHHEQMEIVLFRLFDEFVFHQDPITLCLYYTFISFQKYL